MPTLLLEAALVMVLFADASSLDVRRWTREAGLAGRLLGLGLPLTMLAGALVALLLVPGMEIWQAALIGVILAPTDAALGQAVVANLRVPAVIRNALNVESGLNDGLALPFVTIFITVGLVATGADTELQAVQTLALALVGSTVIGAAAGIAGGWLLRRAAELGLGRRRWQPIALVALAVAIYLAADEIGASGFLAVWVAGLAAGTVLRRGGMEEAFELSEELADVLGAVGFLLLGAGLIVPVIQRATPEMVAYAAPQPHGRAHAPGRAGDAPDGLRPGQHGLRRLVRAPGARLDRVRDGGRGGGGSRCLRHLGRRAAHRGDQHGRPRRHGGVGCRPLRDLVRGRGRTEPRASRRPRRRPMPSAIDARASSERPAIPRPAGLPRP